MGWTWGHKRFFRDSLEIERVGRCFTILPFFWKVRGVDLSWVTVNPQGWLFLYDCPWKAYKSGVATSNLCVKLQDQGARYTVIVLCK